MRRSPAPTWTTAITLATVLLAACGDADQRSESNYCTQVGEHLADIGSPSIATQDDINRTVSAWRKVAASAPIAVEREWKAMVVNIETAATVNPNDPASMQKVADTARASEQAANRVIDYTLKKCGVTIGGVAPVVTTTVPAATTEP